MDIAYNKSKKFAIRIINLYKFLNSEKKEFIMSKQLLRSGTSIGANLAESEHAQSIDDFIHKKSIALKEAHECEFWLELLFETNYLTKNEYDSLQNDCAELNKLLIAAIKTTKLRNM